ncbi:MAG: tetratricopeptide repeat protein, partial [Usitatibacteraceae bacterium]
MRKSVLWLIAYSVIVVPAIAGAKEDCRSKDAERQIRGCSAIIEAGTESPSVMAEAHYNLGGSFYTKGDYERALVNFKRAASYNFQSENLYIAIGGAHRHLRDFQKALEAYYRALELNPKSHRAYYGIGNVYFDKGLHAQAIQKYD